MPEIPPMSPALIEAIHDDLDHAREVLDRCIARVSVMAGFPDPGDDYDRGNLTLPNPRLPPPPLPRRSLPPKD